MKCMVIVRPGNQAGYEKGEMPSSELLEKMGKFNQELVEAGIMLAGEGLKPSSAGARIHFTEGVQPRITHGPFSESSDTVGGFWIWQVKSKEEALAWAQKAPMEENAVLEIRPIFGAEDFGEQVEKEESLLRQKMEQQQNQ